MRFTTSLPSGRAIRSSELIAISMPVNNSSMGDSPSKNSNQMPTDRDLCSDSCVVQKNMHITVFNNSKSISLFKFKNKIYDIFKVEEDRVTNIFK